MPPLKTKHYSSAKIIIMTLTSSSLDCSAFFLPLQLNPLCLSSLESSATVIDAMYAFDAIFTRVSSRK